MTKESLFKIHIIYLIFFLFIFSHFAFAQESQTEKSPAALEVQNQSSLWKKSTNPAGLQLDKPFQYSQLSVGYESYSGDFYRPQQGDRGNRQLIQTEGDLLWGNYYLSGSFAYVRDNIKDATFNASIIDPYRGMPFIIADTNPSDWNNQHYDLKFRIASPLFKDLWSFGLEGNYKASSGAKQRDVRAENYYYTIGFKPGIVFSPNKHHHIGANLAWSNMKEESLMNNVNLYIDQTYYELFGLGTAVSYVGSGRTNNYEGDALGAAVQYHYQGSAEVFFSVDYAAEAEDLRVSYTTPMDGGSILRHIWNTKLSLLKKTGRFTHYADVNYYDRNIDGIQYISQRDNSSSQQGWMNLFKSIRSTYSVQKIGARYSLMQNKGSEYSWSVNAGWLYENIEDEYLLPNSVKEVKNATFNLGGKKNFIVSGIKNKRLSVGLELGYKSNLSGKYVYNGANADFPIVTDLEQNDFNYLSSDYISIGVPLMYSQQLSENNSNQFFIKAAVQYMKTDSFDYSRRHFASLSIGSNF